MDGRRFDELTKTLAVGISRRNLVRGAIGSSFAAVMAALGRETAQAKPKPKTCKVGCAGLPGKQEKACEKACKACGGDFNRVCTKDWTIRSNRHHLLPDWDILCLRCWGLLRRGDRTVLRADWRCDLLRGRHVLQLRHWSVRTAGKLRS